MSPKGLLALHEAGRLLLIFDAFDEMDLVGDANLRLDHFRTLWDFSHDKLSKILITGRPNFFLDQIEREKSLNIRPQTLDVPYTVPVYLSPFTPAKIESALRAFDIDIREEIIDAVTSEDTSLSFKDLLGRPATLFLAANIWKELHSLASSGQIFAAEVIGRFIRHSYERQQGKRLRSMLTVTEREYFTIGIACAALSESQVSNQISSGAFQDAIAQLTDLFPEELADDHSALEHPLPPLKERLHDRDMLLETISTEVRSCGIIVTDLSQTDVFKFAHKSFFEYLIGTNEVLTAFKWRPSKEVIANNVARKACLKSRPRSVRFGLLGQTGGDSRLNQEMIQFGAEYLYKLLGVKADDEAYRIYSNLPSPKALNSWSQRTLRMRAFMWRFRVFRPFAMSLFQIRDREPLYRICDELNQIHERGSDPERRVRLFPGKRNRSRGNQN